jgi:hypothetical protein
MLNKLQNDKDYKAINQRNEFEDYIGFISSGGKDEASVHA